MWQGSRLNKYLLAAVVCLATALPVLSAQKEDKQEKKQEAINQAHAAQVEAAQSAAAAWLAVVDAEKYAASWEQAAPFLKAHITEKDWEKHLETMRRSIDPMVDRTLHTTQYRDQFPGLPSGQYVAFVWETYFTAKQPMLESVIMSFDGSQWKAVGYAVQ